MSVTALPVSTHDLSTGVAAIPEADTASFEERWIAWQARGAVHDRAVRRRMMFAFRFSPLLLPCSTFL